MASTPGTPTTDPGAPPLVRRAAWGFMFAAVAGAAYLIWVRGEAIIVDLSTLAGKVWCF